MKFRRRMAAATLAAVGLALISTGSPALAYTQNGTTVFDSTYSSSGCSPSSCHKLTDTIAAYTTGVTGGAHTWSLYLSSSSWCDTGNSQVGLTSWTGTGNVPRNTIKGNALVTAGTYELCFKNTAGETAAPVSMTMI